MWAAARCALPWAGRGFTKSHLTINYFFVSALEVRSLVAGAIIGKCLAVRRQIKRKSSVKLFSAPPSLAHVVPNLLCKREVWADVW